MNRRNLIKTPSPPVWGRRTFLKNIAIFAPTYLLGKKLIAQDLSPASSISTRGLVGYWKMDYLVDTTKVWDASAQGNHGTIQGGMSAPINAARRGQCLTFDGTDDYVSGIGSVSSYSFPQNTMVFSVSAWIKLDTLTNSQYIVSNSAATAEKGWGFYYTNDGGADGTKTLAIVILKGSPGTPLIVALAPDNTIVDANWHHVVATGGGASNSISLYIDGVSQSVTYPVSFSSLSSGDSTRSLSIGAFIFGVPLGFMDGSIDEVRIYDRTLSAGEVKILYHQ